MVRLETVRDADREILGILLRELDLSEDDVYPMPSLLDYTTLEQIASLSIAALHYPSWPPHIPPKLAEERGSIFQALRFLQEAVADPNELAIKMTLYPTGEGSLFVPLLMQAAEAGKQVVCLVELKARFDEQQNIQIARHMEKVGVHVVYGMGRLKTHTKTALVVRREGEEVRCYAHIGTGNYHSRTARLYADLALLTADEKLTEDVAGLFNYLTCRSR